MLPTRALGWKQQGAIMTKTRQDCLNSLHLDSIELPDHIQVWQT